MHVFGLTGGIASGKSTVARVFQECGVPVIDADDVARAVVAKGSPGLEAVINLFGRDMLDKTGELDRKRLASVVFSDPTLRGQLNGIVHPLVGLESARRIEQLRIAGHKLACYDAALLVENGLADAFRPLVVVATSRQNQCERLQARDGLNLEQADARLNAQAPVEFKLAAADLVIRNDGDVSDLKAQAISVLERVRMGIGQSASPTTPRAGLK